MPTDRYHYEPIGVVRTPFESPEGMPIQPAGADTVAGTVEVKQSYVDGLQDLNGFSHCILLYHFHAAADTASLRVEPFLDEEKRGVFATRAPQRPNRIGLSVVEIESVTGSEVAVRGIDVVDETPLLDIKPFVPDFDVPEDVDTGWLDASKSTIKSEQADERFL
ncbi:MAG: tRNA (N6-threonylcarbamoyladenosine(37)-N6)-methyltransferase TrmO [Methanobacteriota archaeon]